MKVRWSKTALFELDNIFSYISERNPTAAKSVVRRIEGLISQLKKFPYLISGILPMKPEHGRCLSCALSVCRILRDRYGV